MDTLVYIAGSIDFGFNEDTMDICPGALTEVNPDGNPNFEYLWMPEALFDDPRAVNPRVLSDSSVTISVLISDPRSGCSP